jgi:hypothetical protein
MWDCQREIFELNTKLLVIALYTCKGIEREQSKLQCFSNCLYTRQMYGCPLSFIGFESAELSLSPDFL